MRKILLYTATLSLFAIGLIGCSQQAKWNQEQREAIREALRSYRQMIYLEDLNEAEFALFTDQAAEMLEEAYPVYTSFVSMPSAVDTMDLVTVTAIVDQLDADPRNLRHIYPYSYLVAQGTLPAGLDYEQQHAFYRCLAGKVNMTYTSMAQFFNAILSDSTATSQMRELESQCANDLFSWTVTEIDIMEEGSN